MSEIIPYIPECRVRPERNLEGWPTAWHPNEEIIPDIMKRFHVYGGRVLEVGSEHGHSAIALSNYFEQVIAVDSWLQKITDQSRPMFGVCMLNFEPYENIYPCRMPWQVFVRLHSSIQSYDLIHYDGEHCYADTYGFCSWAFDHTDVLIAHDVCNQWRDVVPALSAVAEKHGLHFYRFEEGEGLGILSRRSL